MRWITSRRRAITCGKSTAGVPARIPKCSASRSVCTTAALRISALLGTQPVFRQSPPISPASIRVTRAFYCGSDIGRDQAGRPRTDHDQVAVKLRRLLPAPVKLTRPHTIEHGTRQPRKNRQQGKR